MDEGQFKRKESDQTKMSNVDYKKLGEVQGKAWRLGHPNGSRKDQSTAMVKASMKVPEPSLRTFNDGFRAGVKSVDQNKSKA